jgi:exodeoxyribonuclease VII small subunit
MNPPEFVINSSPVEAMPYELAYAELETIVAALEDDGASLENALALFERGQALSRHCAALLDQAELKVRLLSGETLIDFEPDA